MSWYASPWLLFPLYGVPTLVVALAITIGNQLFINKKLQGQHKVGDPCDERLCINLTLPINKFTRSLTYFSLKFKKWFLKKSVFFLESCLISI